MPEESRSRISHNDRGQVAMSDPFGPMIFVMIGVVAATAVTDSMIAILGVGFLSLLAGWLVLFGFERWVA